MLLIMSPLILFFIFFYMHANNIVKLKEHLRVNNIELYKQLEFNRTDILYGPLLGMSKAKDFIFNEKPKADPTINTLTKHIRSWAYLSYTALIIVIASIIYVTINS